MSQGTPFLTWLQCALKEDSVHPAHSCRLPKKASDPWLTTQRPANTDHSVRMCRLICVFAGRIFSPVGNAVSRLIFYYNTFPNLKFMYRIILLNLDKSDKICFFFKQQNVHSEPHLKAISWANLKWENRESDWNMMSLPIVPYMIIRDSKIQTLQ